MIQALTGVLSTPWKRLLYYCFNNVDQELLKKIEYLKTRKVILGGINTNPDGDWTTQVARNFTGYDDDMYNAKFLIRDRDSKFTESFDNMFKSIGCKTIKLPCRSPNLNAFAERWIRSIKYECLNNMILFGEKQLRYVIKNYIDHYNSERTHQGINNQIPIPDERSKTKEGIITKSSRLGGMLNFYYRKTG